MKDSLLTLNEVDKSPRLLGWHSLLSGLATLTLLAILAGFVNWQSVWKELLTCQKSYVLVGAACHYLTYPLRGMRWRRCLAHLPIGGSIARFVQVVFFYNFLDNVVPAKLGDVYAAHLARINFGIRRSEAIGSIVFTRMLDAWVLLTIALAASWLLLSTHLPNPVLWALIGGAAIAMAATLIMLTFFFLDKFPPRWVPNRIEAMIRAFRNGMWPQAGELLPIFALTAGIWILETLWIYLLMLGFDVALALDEVLFLTVIPLLASAFPLTPSGAGVVELTLFSCLRLIGTAAPLAESITLLNRFIDYWLHIGLGILMWLFRHQLGLHIWRGTAELSFVEQPILPMKLSK
ncbi:MAG: lysylphosphatidylglycerol synthase transmembrane domain-containing protein [Desulforhabdus sp.]|jgi:uncharacterized protein (TIRG00374 family)|nr:lysylphosphatidylglycerol synthase transmembrane domain-containing protein [Desulforhabdus sp.]